MFIFDRDYQVDDNDYKELIEKSIDSVKKMQ
jgi:hypothetical protein